MNIFVAWTVDHLDGLTATALMSENIEELRQISHSVKRGADAVKSWAMAVGGSPILDLGHTGSVQVPTDRMTELPAIAKKFEDICEATLSIGVGMSLSEAYTAMKFSMQKGGDRISLYHIEMEDSLNDEGLNKAQEGLVGLQDESNQAGFAASAQHGAGGKFASKPSETHPPPAAPAPPSSPPPGDIDMSMGDGSQDPNGGQFEGEGESEDPRAAVVNALKEIKRQAPVLEQLKQSNPDAFNAIKEVVDAMILMAQGMAAQDESVQKSEDQLPGGLADKKKPSDFDEKELSMGIQHEKEHTNDEKLAREIAMDHLSEDPHYYSNLKKQDAPGTYHEWAVGHVKGGKIKVAHKDVETNAPKTTGWHSVRAGQVLSEDGHAISARNPNGK